MRGEIYHLTVNKTCVNLQSQLDSTFRINAYVCWYAIFKQYVYLGSILSTIFTQVHLAIIRHNLSINYLRIFCGACLSILLLCTYIVDMSKPKWQSLSYEIWAGGVKAALQPNGALYQIIPKP